MSLNFVQEILSSNMLVIILSLAFLSIYFFLKRKVYLFSLFLLPGTLVHELSHFLVALILNGQPTKLSIFPHRTDKGVLLGHVICNNPTWYNSLFIGLSPLLLLPLSVYFLYILQNYPHNIF